MHNWNMINFFMVYHLINRNAFVSIDQLYQIHCLFSLIFVTWSDLVNSASNFIKKVSGEGVACYFAPLDLVEKYK
jgi:hypothetical protein